MALQAKLIEAGSDLIGTGRAVKFFLGDSQPPQEHTISAADEAIKRIPDKSDLQSTLDEWRVERDRLRDLNSQLSDFHG